MYSLEICIQSPQSFARKKAKMSKFHGVYSPQLTMASSFKQTIQCNLTWELNRARSLNLVDFSAPCVKHIQLMTGFLYDFLDFYDPSRQTCQDYELKRNSSYSNTCVHELDLLRRNSM